VPQAFPEQPDPLTLHVTAVFVVPVTVAWNSCWLPIVTIVVVGVMATLMGLMMVTAALADVTPSAIEVAVTVTVAGEGTASGAVYKPPEVIVPHADPTQPVPLTLQVTPVTSVLITLAVNCWLAPASSCTEAGEMLTPICSTMITVAVLDFVVSATDVAVTFRNDGLGSDAGAVYRPPAVMVPQLVPAHPKPVTLQVTAVLLVPVTAALNSCCAPVFSWTLAGEIVTPTWLPEVMVTVVDPTAAGVNREAAVITTEAGLGIAVGAV
jgi:hypothetical protein